MPPTPRRIVVKVGTNVMTNRDHRVVRPVLRELVRQIAAAYDRHGVVTVLVSSGSIIQGREILGAIDAANETQRRQVYSATGQPRLMRLYHDLFAEYGLTCAQVLPTKRDFQPGAHRDNMVQCYEGLLAAGVFPVANEDDAVSVTQSMFHDNDELAGLMAGLLDAERFVILTDRDGLYDGHPDADGARLVARVAHDADLDHLIHASGKAAGEGRGGMGSKLRFAQATAARGIPSHIADGRAADTLLRILDGEDVGTFVAPRVVAGG